MVDITLAKLRKYLLRAKVTLAAAPGGPAETNDSRLQDIAAGQPQIYPETTEAFVAQMLNLDLLGGISFNKGCYTGQEIVARTENLGRSKRRTFRYRCDAPDLQIGDKLQDGAADAGVIVNVCGNDLLAVTAVAAAGRSLQIRGSTAIPQPLPYEVT